MRKLIVIFLTLNSYFLLFSQEDQQFELPSEYEFLNLIYSYPDSTIKLITEKESELREVGNKREIIEFYLVIGKFYLSQGLYDRALNFFILTKDKIKQANFQEPDLMAEIENRIADIYKYRKNNELALKTYDKSLFIARKSNLSYWLAETYNNKGDIYRYQNEFEKAYTYYDSCFNISKSNNFKGLIGNTFNNIGDLYNDRDNFDSSLVNYYRSIAIYQKEGLNEFIGENYNSIGELYIKKNDYKNAEKFLTKATELLEDGTYYAEQIKNLNLLDTLYIVTGESDKRINIMETELQLLKTSYENRLKSNISALKVTQELQQMKLKNDVLEKNRIFDYYIRIGIIILLIIIIYVAILLYSKYSQKKKFSDVKEQQNREILSQKLKLEEAITNIQHLNNELKDLNSTKDRFFSIIAHDLKGPISNLKQLSEILQKEIETISKEDLIDFIESIAISSKATMTLLENLLEWSRIQLGSIKFEPEAFELKMVSSEVTDLLSTSADNKNLKLKDNVKMDQIVKGDPNMINTVVRNLVSNAIKFTPEGGEVSINSEEVKDKFVVSVADNGVGISEENIKKLFRVDEHHTTMGTSNEKGTGLGLILCKEFIEKHGGDIWVESEIGKGTTFKFTLPKSIA